MKLKALLSKKKGFIKGSQVKIFIIKNGNNELYRKKNTVLITKTTNNKLGLNIDDLRNNKNIQSTNIIPKKFTCHSNSNKIIYEPKKLGVIKVRSTDKSSLNNAPIYSNMSYDPNKYLNNKKKEAFVQEITKNKI